MSAAKARLVVVGAGPMGLAAAYYAAKRGVSVDVVEAGDRVGGMAAHFDFEGLSIERFYHFCCLSDSDTMALLADLGMSDTMKWVSTKMGYFVDGKLYRWGDPFALLTFPKLGPIEKLRYGLQVFLATKRQDWSKLDSLSARDWFIGWCGQDVYDRLWKPLLELKFYEYSGKVSAAWMWQRIKRLGRSRKSLLEERLGYIEGGSETLMNALAVAIEKMGGRIHLNAPAERICIENGAVTGVRAGGQMFDAEAVISTAPTPVLAPLLADAPADMREAYARIDNIAVVCVIHKLARPVTQNFWVNISDAGMDIPGIVEFSNLRPLPQTVVYVPYYMPATNPKFARPDAEFIAESWAYLRRINPALTDADRLSSRVGRLRHAQPVYEIGFRALLPSVQTPVKGLQIADTCFYYPEDRGVSESVRLAKVMVDAL